MKFIKKTLTLALGSLLLVSAQSAMALPSAFQATYLVAKGSMKLGNLKTTLKYSGKKYSYHKYTKATGVAALLTGMKITENSNGQISGQNIIPKTYLYNRARRGKSKVEKIQFAGNRATGNYRGNAFNLATAHGIQDKSSLELSLARDLSANKARLSYTVITHGEKRTYNFQKLGSEVLKTKAGTFHTIKVKVARKGNKRETTFWMAKELGYIPVKVIHREKNDVISTIISQYKKR